MARLSGTVETRSESRDEENKGAENRSEIQSTLPEDHTRPCDAPFILEFLSFTSRLTPLSGERIGK
jgi:hypothetical protein